MSLSLLHVPPRDNEPDSGEPLRFSWHPAVGVFLGSVFVVAGVLIGVKVLGAGWWIDTKVRIIFAITIILYGIYRIVVFLPKLTEKKRKSMQEQIDELEKK